MHLDCVQLDNFGIYHQRRFDFGRANIILLYGPNEAGKTTALNGLRQALFGFRTKTPYLTSGRVMSAEVHASMANGSQLVFTRRKGRQDEIQGSLDNRSIDPRMLQQLLGNLDLGSYEQLFGFALDELRTGEESLKSAQLSEALAGGGLGGINALQRLRQELNVTLADLYKARGTKSLINLKLNDIQTTRSELGKVQVLPAQIEQLQQQLMQLARNNQDVSAEYNQLFLDRLQATKLLEMLPIHYRSKRLNKQLQEMNLPDNIDLQFVVHWSEYSSKHQELEGLIREESDALHQENLLLESLGGHSPLISHEDAIESLGIQADEITSLRAMAEELQTVIHDSSSQCQRLQEKLGIDLIDDRLRQFTVTQLQQLELQKMSQQISKLEKSLLTHAADLEAARKTLGLLGVADESMVPNHDDLDDLAFRLEQLSEAEKKSQRLQTDLTQLQSDSLMQQLELQLNMQTQSGLRIDWRLPTTQSVRQSAQTHSDFEQQYHQKKKLYDDIEREIASIQSQSALVDQSSIEQTLAALEQNRNSRDELLSMWLEDLSQPLIAASLTCDLQQERLRQLQSLARSSDQLQNLLMDSAQQIAIYQATQKQLERIQRKRHELESELEQLSELRQQELLRWKMQWEDLGIIGLNPDDMLQWLDDFDRWRQHQRQISTIYRELRATNSLARQLRTALLDLWPGKIRSDTDVSVLNAQLNRWRDLDRDFQKNRQQAKSIQLDIDRIEAISQQSDRQLTVVKAQYQDWLAQVPTKLAWPIDQSAVLIESLDRLKSEDDRRQRATEELKKVRRRLEEFEQSTQNLAAELQQTLPPHAPAEQLVKQWFTEIKSTREQNRKRETVQATIGFRQRRLDELERELAQLNSRLAALCVASGSSDMKAADSLAARVRQADQLRQEVSECQVALESQAGGQSMETLTKLLDQTNEAQLHMKIEDIGRRLNALEQQRQQTDQQIGSLNQQIDQISQSHQASKLEQQLHHQRQELGEMCQQWAVHRLAAEILDRSVERFSNEHEPVLLQYTRQFLNQLTAGRYRDVEHDTANPLRFIVRNSAGEPYQPDQLSTGTREQLYLAIRMAFITHYCDRHEPVPVIMDDCFVNFDDARTAHALEAIANWEISAQRILLSCHQRVVRSLAQISPEAPCIHLQRAQTTTVAELAAEFT